MAYTDLTKILLTLPKKIVVQLTDDNNTGEIDTAIVDNAIVDADNTIDLYARGRYPADIPDVDVPEFYKTISTGLAICNLYDRKLTLTLPEPLQKKCDRAMEMLKSIQKGDLTPFEPDDEPEVVIVKTRPRDFTIEFLEQFKC